MELSPPKRNQPRIKKEIAYDGITKTKQTHTKKKGGGGRRRARRQRERDRESNRLTDRHSKKGGEGQKDRQTET